MPEEEKKEEGADPILPSEGKTEAAEPPKEEPKTAETIDYRAEWEKIKSEIQEKEKEISRLGYRNRKVEKTLADSGIEIPESENLSKDDVQEIVVQSIQQAMKPLSDELEKTKGLLSEAQRALAGKETESKGGGAGQKPVQKKPMPPLNEESKNIVRKFGLRWDADQEAFVGKSGKIYPGVVATELPAE